MSSKFSRPIGLAAVVVCLFVSLCAAAGESPGVVAPEMRKLEYQVPCLTVYADGSHGHISRLPLKFTRTGADKPLRILIGDDTPGGSGETIRNSVWLAAVTAAMLRNDTMHGATISVEFSGNIDGPSAGGVICLAILSALDGRPLPNDFAMTGTILPDGTIGVVGGVPEKMRAAARSGVRKIFIPAFLRIVKDPRGEEVDLSRLAEELKVELFRVTNISEAYAVLHNQPYSGDGYVNVYEMTKLPAATEDVLIAHYKALRQVVEAKLAENPELAELPLFPAYQFSPAKAETYYHEGKLLPAAELMFRSRQAWLAWEKTLAFVNEFDKKYDSFWDQLVSSEAKLRKQISAFRNDLPGYERRYCYEQWLLGEKYRKKYYPGEHSFTGYYPFRNGQTEISAQLESVGTDSLLSGQLSLLKSCRLEESALNQASEEDLKKAWWNEWKILAFTHLSQMDTSPYNEFLGELGDTLPRLRPNRRASEVERLFHSGAHAVGSAAWGNLQETVNALAARGEQISASELFQMDSLLPVFQLLQQSADSAHNRLSPRSEKRATFPDYQLQASLKLQVETLAAASAVLVTYDGNDSNDFISHLRRNAREAAIRNISECVKAGIPCLPAICDFEIAEGTDDSPTDILIPYWRASLYSKALLMSFRQE